MKKRPIPFLLCALLPLACLLSSPLSASPDPEAEPAVHAVLDEGPAEDDGATLYRLGLAAYRDGDYEEALRRWCSVVHDRPNCIEVYLRIAAAHYRLGEFGRAEKVFRYVLARDGGNRLARKGLLRLRRERAEAEAVKRGDPVRAAAESAGSREG